MEEILNNQPFHHAVVWTRCNIILQTVPSFWDCLLVELLEAGDFTSEGIGFATGKYLVRNALEHASKLLLKDSRLA